MTKLSQLETQSHSVIVYKCMLYHPVVNKGHMCLIYKVKTLAVFHAKL